MIICILYIFFLYICIYLFLFIIYISFFLGGCVIYYCIHRCSSNDFESTIGSVIWIYPFSSSNRLINSFGNPCSTIGGIPVYTELFEDSLLEVQCHPGGDDCILGGVVDPMYLPSSNNLGQIIATEARFRSPQNVLIVRVPFKIPEHSGLGIFRQMSPRFIRIRPCDPLYLEWVK